MWSAETLEAVLAPHAGRLIALARESIRYGLDAGEPIPVTLSAFERALHGTAATFVTLHRTGELRGCVGTLEARATLAEDVARNAFLAAFADSRFAPVQETEIARLSIEISVLGPHQPIAFASESELLRRLMPGRDGLIIERGGRRGVFLPQVWEELPDPADFVSHLKRKAGIGEAPLDRSTQAHSFTVVKLTAETRPS